MTTFELETWFSGGGLADIGFKQAGLTPTVAVELEPAIAAVYAQNLERHCLPISVQSYSQNMLQDFIPFWFHVSPPCTNASVAKTDSGETELDIAMARAVCRGIERQSPWFSLENVWGYRAFESFRLIEQALSENGYNFAYWHLNSADYGVPQTRKRLILIASRIKRVVQPQPTHGKNPGLFWKPWVGWYEAIEDLIPSLPESQFAPWQLERLPKNLITANKTGAYRAFIVSDQRSDGGQSLTMRQHSQPAYTVEASKSGVHVGRAFLADGLANSNGSTLTVIASDRPSFTVKASCHKQASRAWLSTGRVVSMTVKAIARFQSVPDWYRFSGKNSLDCKIIGNGVPCLLTQKMVEAQEVSA